MWVAICNLMERVRIQFGFGARLGLFYLPFPLNRHGPAYVVYQHAVIYPDDIIITVVPSAAYSGQRFEKRIDNDEKQFSAHFWGGRHDSIVWFSSSVCTSVRFSCQELYIYLYKDDIYGLLAC